MSDDGLTMKRKMMPCQNIFFKKKKGILNSRNTHIQTHVRIIYISVIKEVDSLHEEYVFFCCQLTNLATPLYLF